MSVTHATAGELTDAVGAMVAKGLDSLTDGFALINDVGEVVFSNQAWIAWHRAATGLNLGPGTNVLAVVAETTVAGREWFASYRSHLREANAAWLELSWRPGRWVRVCFAIQGDGAVLGVVTDITEQREREIALRESAERFRSFAVTSGDWFWELDDELRYRMCTVDTVDSDASPDDELVGTNFIEHLRRIAVTADDVDVIASSMLAHEPFRECEVRIYDDDGNEQVSSLSGMPFIGDDGRFRGYRGSVRNVSDARGLARRLTYQANHDDLTGLVNRRGLIARIARLIKEREVSPGHHALCFLDVDQIKVINDTCGYGAGDALINRIAQMLRDGLRGADAVARMGGDEFAVLLRDSDPYQAEALAEKIRKGIADRPFTWEGQQFRITVSVGVAPLASDMLDANELLRAADSACYAAKERGRNRVKLYALDDSTLNLRQGEMHWVARIHAALAEDRFEMYLQPIAPTGGDDPGHLHYEALLRMYGRDGRIFSPGAFLPAAERYNLASQIDAWVLDNIIGWLDRSPLFLDHLSVLAVNLSGQSLGEPAFLSHVQDRMRRYPQTARKLCFEITETAAISNLDRVQEFMKSMRRFGSSFALDDFGAGLSSFAYLRTLDVEYLKIDGMFVKDVNDDPIYAAMVGSINEVGHVMGKKTIAEFVENDNVRRKLAEIGVDFVQGQGIGEPVPFAEVL